MKYKQVMRLSPGFEPISNENDRAFRPDACPCVREGTIEEQRTKLVDDLSKCETSSCKDCSLFVKPSFKHITLKQQRPVIPC